MNIPMTKVVTSYLWIFSSFSLSATFPSNSSSSSSVGAFVFVARNNLFRRRRNIMSDEFLISPVMTSEQQRGMSRRPHEPNDWNGDSPAQNSDCNTVNDRSQKRSRRQKRPPNRPGRNSYLKVVLDDRTIDILHQMSLQIQSKIHEPSMRATASLPSANPPKIEGQPQNTESSPKLSESATIPVLPIVQSPISSSNSSREQNISGLSYKPRSRDSLHMTLFFGGETICALPPEELQNWHRRVRERLATSGFYLDCSEGKTTRTAKNRTVVNGGDIIVEDCSSAGVRPGDGDDENKNYDFLVQGLRVFPPQRKNLVVAILEAQQEWHNLYSDLRQIASDETCSPQLAKVVEYDRSIKDKWIAHVTLGNLRGGPSKKSDRSNLDDTLLKPIFDSTVNDMLTSGKTEEEGQYHHHQQQQQQEEEDGRIKQLLRAKTTGIGMGGPIPKHQLEDLDWNFHFFCHRQEDE